MSLGDWTAWNNRTSRPLESVREDVAPEPQPRDEPIEVEESDPSQTWIGKMFRWPKGTP